MVAGVQRTEDSKLLLFPSGPAPVFRFLVLLLALAATSVFGQASVVTLAMVSYDQSPARTPAAARNDSAASPFRFASAPCLQYRWAGLNLDHQFATAFSTDFPLEKQNGIWQRDWFQWVHKKSSADGRTGSWVHLEAGYGQFCQFESGIGKNIVELQQPSCAYLRASFNF